MCGRRCSEWERECTRRRSGHGGPSENNGVLVGSQFDSGEVRAVMRLHRRRSLGDDNGLKIGSVVVAIRSRVGRNGRSIIGLLHSRSPTATVGTRPAKGLR